MTDNEFARLVATLYPRLVRYCRKFGARADAEDLVQDTLIAIWTSRAHVRFRGDSTAFGWLCTCLHHAAVTEIRRRTTARRRIDVAEYVCRLDEREAEHAAAHAVLDTIAGFEGDVQRALRLRLCGYTWKEIAGALQTSPMTIWYRVKRALETEGGK